MTTPTGRLAYGQAGVYDALDDRAVITALSGYRTGLVGLVGVAAGSGLMIVVSGGWLGIADCGDRTSAVVGSPVDAAVEASPGPPTGTREDRIWIDVDPDEGTWTMSVVPASATAGRPGLALAYITVPANATLASQMTIRPADVTAERRMLGFHETTETNVRTGTTWETVGTCVSTDTFYGGSGPVTCQPGRWYRCRFTANSPMAITSQYHPPGMRIGIGLRPVGGDSSASLLWRASVIAPPVINAASHASVERTYRHSGPAVTRHFDGRIWIAGVGSFRTCAITTQGPGLVLTVEDLGS